MTADTNEVYSLTSQQNFVSKLICKEGRDHNVVELIFVSPQLVLTNF